MRMFLFIACFALLMIPFSNHASPISQAPIKGQACKNFYTEIQQDISAANTCWNDTDCELHHYGCPWQLGICHHSLSSYDNKEDRRQIYQKIQEFEEECFTNNEPLTKYCKHYEDIRNDTICKSNIPLLCVEGRCVTKTHVLLQQGGGEGQDPYGSLKVINTIKPEEEEEAEK